MENHELSALSLIDNALNLLTGHVHFDTVLVSTLFSTVPIQLELPCSKIKVIGNGVSGGGKSCFPKNYTEHPLSLSLSLSEFAL